MDDIFAIPPKFIYSNKNSWRYARVKQLRAIKMSATNLGQPFPGLQCPIDARTADAERPAMAVALRTWAFSANKEVRFAATVDFSCRSASASAKHMQRGLEEIARALAETGE